MPRSHTATIASATVSPTPRRARSSRCSTGRCRPSAIHSPTSGLFLLYWGQSDAQVIATGSALGAQDGFLDHDAIVEAYARRSGRDLSALDWSRLAGVYTDYIIERPKLHAVCSDQYRSLLEALQRLRGMGYRRPGKR